MKTTQYIVAIVLALFFGSIPFVAIAANDAQTTYHCTRAV
jgi:hypothetical protein